MIHPSMPQIFVEIHYIYHPYMRYGAYRIAGEELEASWSGDPQGMPMAYPWLREVRCVA